MHPISYVERDTGLTKEVLRKWEARFGFPLPQRNANGERLYTADDLERLRTIKRLLDTGLRAGALVPLPPEDLARLDSGRSMHATFATSSGEFAEKVMLALRKLDVAAVRGLIAREISASGLRHFVLAIMPSLNDLVGMAWESGELAVFQEHIYSEAVRSLMLDEIRKISASNTGVRVIISTPPEERHDFGMLMLHAILALEGASCISLGLETPGSELVLAAKALKADVVALSFSIAYPKRQIPLFLTQLRAGLSSTTELWAGGGGVARLRKLPEGVRVFGSLDMAAKGLPALR